MRKVFVCRALGDLGAALLVMACFATTGLGQAVSGTVVGTVSDTSGAAIAGTEVQASNVATGVTLATTTNASGEYRFNTFQLGITKFQHRRRASRLRLDRRPLA